MMLRFTALITLMKKFKGETMDNIFWVGVFVNGVVLAMLGYNAINKGSDNLKNNWYAYAIATVYVVFMTFQ